MAQTIALVGNPNSGKTTLFNALTGSNQHVGNWPGVTVEKKSGKVKMGDAQAEVVDLPGIYSLSPHSLEEIIARNYIIDESPDVIINIVDGTNLERNLYLTLQVLEMGKPTVLAVNMMDEVRKNNDKVDIKGLEQALGIPVISISARQKENIDTLLKAAMAAKNPPKDLSSQIYGEDGAEAITQVEALLAGNNALNKSISKAWYAIKVLENDEAVKKLSGMQSIMPQIKEIGKKIGADEADQEIFFASKRYDYIGRIASKNVTRKRTPQTLTLSDKIDKVLTNRIAGIPIFLGIMYIMFAASFNDFTDFLTDTLDGFFGGTLAELVANGLSAIGTADWLTALLCEGVIAGVGAVLGFLPQILVIFIFLTILEDSGYMARVAFIMDRVLRKIGLSGKSFVPMLIGFGCSVPAVMATRTIENEKDRHLTMVLTPFMSCGARAPIYALFVGAFFSGGKVLGFISTDSLVVFSIYLLGIVVAILSGILLRNTVFKGPIAPFVMELPPYRLPNVSSFLLHIWEKAKSYVVRAGTIILAISVLIWVLTTFGPHGMVEDASESLLAIIGGFIAPIFTPLGFGNWQAGVSLLTGLVAKEAVVSTMEVIYAVGEGNTDQLVAMLPQMFTPLSSYAFMAFSLLYVPCLAVVGVMKREMKKWSRVLATIGYQTAVAWIVGFLIFQIGSLFVG